jgi:hypothetical protein
MLFLKLFLVPSCLLAISLAGRRWGPGVAGWLAGMPVVVGPILLFLALDHGVAFTARAANASLSALCATVALTTSYAHACRHTSWPGSLTIGLCAWAAVASLLSLLPVSIGLSLALAVGVLLAVPRLLPADRGFGATHRIGRAEIGLRMVAGGLLAVAVTALAPIVGTAWSGLFTAFPVLTVVLLAFSHRSQGADFVGAMLRTMAPGLWSYIAFCATLAFTLVQTGGIALSFAAAVAATAAAQWTTRLRAHAAVQQVPKLTPVRRR